METGMRPSWRRRFSSPFVCASMGPALRRYGMSFLLGGPAVQAHAEPVGQDRRAHENAIPAYVARMGNDEHGGQFVPRDGCVRSFPTQAGRRTAGKVDAIRVKLTSSNGSVSGSPNAYSHCGNTRRVGCGAISATIMPVSTFSR